MKKIESLANVSSRNGIPTLFELHIVESVKESLKHLHFQVFVRFIETLEIGFCRYPKCWNTKGLFSTNNSRGVAVGNTLRKSFSEKLSEKLSERFHFIETLATNTKYFTRNDLKENTNDRQRQS